jgi:uncharacterized membrane protein
MLSTLSATDTAGIVAAILLGLSAGLFFAFTVAVMPGLREVGDSAFADTMNSINRVIVNPPFLLAFLGSAIVAVVTAVLAFGAGEEARGWAFAIAAGSYLIGVVGVTGLVNVPLNNALGQNRDRSAFEVRWVRFNTVRTMAGIISLGAALVGLVL